MRVVSRDSSGRCIWMKDAGCDGRYSRQAAIMYTVLVQCIPRFDSAINFLVSHDRARCAEVSGREEDARAELARLQDAKTAADQEVRSSTAR